MGNFIGQAVKRVEDKRFTTGHGKYTDDIILPEMTYAQILRSPYAHAKINSVDTSAAIGIHRGGVGENTVNICL